MQATDAQVATTLRTSATQSCGVGRGSSIHPNWPAGIVNSDGET
jgi:hypothetical protein